MEKTVYYKSKKSVLVNGTDLPLALLVPVRPVAAVIFAGARASEQQILAEKLASQGILVVLADLLTGSEELIFENIQNIPLLTKRLVAITRWSRKHSPAKSCATGLFCFGTSAAAAIRAATVADISIRSVVSVNGRPDLAGEALFEIKAPVLLLSDAHNSSLTDLNQDALRRLNAGSEMRLIATATDGARSEAQAQKLAKISVKWMMKQLVPQKISLEDL